MILGQHMFQVILLLKSFGTDRRNTPIVVRLALGCILSEQLPSTSGFFSTCFKAVKQIESDFNLANQKCNWHHMELLCAYKQVEPRSASNARGQKISEDTTYHDGCRYQVGMLWADDRSSLVKNYVSALVQLKSRAMPKQ